MHSSQRKPISRAKRARYYQQRYGLTLEAFEAFLEVQGGLCGVPTCDRQLDEFTIKCVWRSEQEDGSTLIEGIVCRRCLTLADRPHLSTQRNRTYALAKKSRVTAEPATA